MPTNKQISGMEKIPPIYSRPVWKDRFFRITMAMVAFWIMLAAWFFW